MQNKYKVHVFCVVRVPVEVEADSQQEAIRKADPGNNEWYALFENVRGSQSEYAEETSHYLVDEIEDTEHHKTKWYDANGQESLSEDPTDEHTLFTREDWRHDVANGDTQLGYWKWVAHNLEAAAHCPNCGGSGIVEVLGSHGETGTMTDTEKCEKCHGTGMDIAQAEAVAEQQGQDWASAGEDQNAGKSWS